MSDIKYEIERKYREYPLASDEAFFPQPEAMFNSVLLREAWEYYERKTKNRFMANHFYFWLLCLEDNVPFDQQKYQP